MPFASYFPVDEIAVIWFVCARTFNFSSGQFSFNGIQAKNLLFGALVT